MTAEDAQTVTVEVQCSVFTHQYGDRRGQQLSLAKSQKDCVYYFER